jgi:hypothetical protein
MRGIVWNYESRKNIFRIILSTELHAHFYDRDSTFDGEVWKGSSCTNKQAMVDSIDALQSRTSCHPSRTTVHPLLQKLEHHVQRKIGVFG